jgi:disulfide bond formation protein DsbB
MKSFLYPFSYVVFSATLAAAALLMAFVAQYGFGLRPCPLCLYQRLPYFAVLGVGLVAGLISKGRSIKIVLALIGLWCISLILGAYHSGVEAGFWSFPACESSIQGAANLVELEAMIHQVIVTPCDRPAFLWMGLSMADMNLLLSGAMLGWGFWVFKRTKSPATPKVKKVLTF